MNRLISNDSPRIFENPLLETFSRAHPRLPIILYGPCVVVLAFIAFRQAPAVTVAGWMLAGYVLWTLLEYAGHRFAFHLNLPGAIGARIHFLIHGIHHDFPNDPWRLVMPPLMSLPVLGVAAGLIRLGFGPELFASVAAGFAAGYILYDTMHFELHHREQRTRLGQWLKRRHMLHHFRDATRGFGISCPWLDALFGTMTRDKPGGA